MDIPTGLPGGGANDPCQDPDYDPTPGYSDNFFRSDDVSLSSDPHVRQTVVTESGQLICNHVMKPIVPTLITPTHLAPTPITHTWSCKGHDQNSWRPVKFQAPCKWHDV